MSKRKRLTISFSTVLLLICTAAMVVAFTYLYTFGVRTITSYLYEETGELVQQQVNNASANVEAIFDSMMLTLSQLVEDEAFCRAAEILSDESHVQTDYIYLAETVNTAINDADRAIYKFDIALMCKNGLYGVGEIKRVKPQIKFSTVAQLFEDSLEKYGIDNVTYINPADATEARFDELEEDVKYFSEHVAIVQKIPIQAEEKYAFLMICVEAEKLLEDAESMMLIENSASTVIINRNALETAEYSVKIPKYPYSLLYTGQPSITGGDYFRLRRGMIYTMLIGVAAALVTELVLRRRLKHEIRFILNGFELYGKNGIGHVACVNPPMRASKLKQLGTVMLIGAVVVPTLGYCLGSYAVTFNILNERNYSLVDKRLVEIAKSVDKYFEKKNHVAFSIKYIQQIQNMLICVENSDVEQVRNRIGDVCLQNICTDFIYLYDLNGDLLVSNTTLDNEMDVTLLGMERRFPQYSYSAEIVRGRADSRVMVYSSPIFSVQQAHYLDPIGYLRMEISESELSGLYKNEIGELEGSTMMIVNDKDQIISSNNLWLVGQELSAQDETYEEGKLKKYEIAHLNGYMLVYMDDVCIQNGIKELMWSVLLQEITVLVLIYVIAGVSFLLGLSRFGTLAEQMRAYVPRVTSHKRRFSMFSEVEQLQDEFYRMTQRIDNLVDEVYTQELNRTSMRLQKLRAQVQPHFLNNILESASWLVRLGETEKAQRLLRDLGKFYRYHLNDELEEVLLSEELDCIRCYCQLQDNMFENQVRLSIHVEESLNEISIPCFLLQPLVENAFKHGFRQKKGTGELQISGIRNGAQIILSVRDNGIGISRAQLDELIKDLYQEDGVRNLHVGLRNVAERLKIYYGQKNANMLLELNSWGGLTVRLILPYSKT